MRNVYLLIPVLLLSQCRTPGKKVFDYCYSDGKDVLLLSAAENKEDTLHFIGADADLSPDGARVAYTRYEDGDRRRIEIVGIDSMKAVVLDPACNNCYGPVWSPDGKYIVYNAFINFQWSILLKNMTDSAAPLNISKGLNDKGEAYSPTWSEDSKKILVQDMNAVYMLDLGGKVLERIPIARLQHDPSVSSSSRFLLNKDETKLIFDMEINDTSSQDEPPTAIFVYDRQAKKTVQVSPKGYDCFGPSLKDGLIFFTGRMEGDADPDKGEPAFDIYSVDMDGGDFKMVFKNRRDLSFRRG